MSLHIDDLIQTTAAAQKRDTQKAGTETDGEFSTCVLKCETQRILATSRMPRLARFLRQDQKMS
jgi:hypothetical protein